MVLLLRIRSGIAWLGRWTRHYGSDRSQMPRNTKTEDHRIDFSSKVTKTKFNTAFSGDKLYDTKTRFMCKVRHKVRLRYVT